VKWLLYNVVFALGYPLMAPYYLLRMWRRGGYRRGFLERFARYRPDVLAKMAARRRVWVHAVSVGETFVALGLIERLRARRPDLAFVISTTTSTGHRLALERLHGDDVLVYFPMDFPWIVRRALDRIRPRAFVLVETEVWPNMIRSVRRAGIPLALVNGRVSDGSFRGYRRFRWFFCDTLACFDIILAQSADDQRRYEAIGAAPDRVRTVGSVKFDDTAAEAPAHAVDRLRAECGLTRDAVVLLGGSTWPGEEPVLLSAYARLRASRPDLRLVLVPRHAERADLVDREIRKAGFSCRRRSALRGKGASEPLDANTVLLVDTTGELKMFYALATAIFVGKSLTARGGQNMIEPAALGKPVLVGPHTANFRSVVSEFRAAEAIVEVANASELEKAVEQLLSDGAVRNRYGTRARRVVERNRGAFARTLERLLPLFPPA
jgi:3-deoxy-D-manno-octulosonic-acid transferase